MATDNDILKELMETAPGLAGISRENPYKVPQGYFENLVPKVPVQQAPVRKISFGKRTLKYAAAAVVAGLIALTVWYVVPEKNNTIANLDRSVNVQDISDDEIENYIDGDVSVLSYEAAIPSTDIKDEDIRLMFRDISDKELETFLN
ncbi:MAG: hypothetical protein J7497_02650 [Chitinophagaceae bacterium]|nr:hypothetical protein [Chitinophagaceae bacterium]